MKRITESSVRNNFFHKAEGFVQATGGVNIPAIEFAEEGDAGRIKAKSNASVADVQAAINKVINFKSARTVLLGNKQTEYDTKKEQLDAAVKQSNDNIAFIKVKSDWLKAHTGPDPNKAYITQVWATAVNAQPANEKRVFDLNATVGQINHLITILTADIEKCDRALSTLDDLMEEAKEAAPVTSGTGKPSLDKLTPGKPISLQLPGGVKPDGKTKKTEDDEDEDEDKEKKTKSEKVMGMPKAVGIGVAIVVALGAVAGVLKLAGVFKKKAKAA